MSGIKVRIATVVVAVIITLTTLVGCVGYSLGSYPKTLSKFKHNIVDNLQISGVNDQLRDNSDRGFRGEMYINLGKNEAFPQSGDDPYQQIEKELNYEAANVKIVQTYVYLIEYFDKDLTDEALAEMEKFFRAIHEKGGKMLLRFAYEFTENDKRGPTTEQIVRHCQQLERWFDANEEFALKVVYSVQLGLIGLWGEGHGNKNPHNVKDIIKAVDTMVPDKINVMVRTPAFLSKVPAKSRARYTVHDDFLVGEDHEWGMLSFKHPQYNQLCNISRRSISDGEMPWGRDVSVDDIDKILLLKQVVRYGLTSLSIKHNYMEEPALYPKFELYKWRSEYIAESELLSNKLPYNPKMLTGGKITVFDYLDYHLGYQLALSDFNLVGGKMTFMVNNYGFAAPLGYAMEVSVGGKVLYTKTARDMKLYQFGQYIVKIDLPQSVNSGDVKVRFVSERDGATIKVANELAYADGWNIIKG